MSIAGRLRMAALFLPAFCLGVSAGFVAKAQEQLVYWPLVTDGTDYRRVSYPQQAGALLVLADTEVILEARQAPVSYWPITREYLADLSRDPQFVEASLEIVDSSGAVTTIEPEPYVLWYPEGAAAGPAELVRGEAAVQFYEDYVRDARAAALKTQEYQRIVAEHRAVLEAWLRMAAEQRGENMPAPPPELDIEEPEPYRAYASEPRQAVIVSLPSGRYTVRLRGPDGEIVAGSERKLVSFAPVDKGIGYVLRPQDRWTQPVFSFAPDATIYTTGRADLFVQPLPVVEYEAERFTRLFRPQSVEVTDPALTMWVPDEGSEAPGDALALWEGSNMAERAPRTPYRVAQIPGQSRGYVIEEFAPGEGSPLEPDFSAMRVAGDSVTTKVSLLADGEKVGASERQVRRVTPPAEPLLFAPALLPLAVGVALRYRRKRAIGS